MASRSWLDVLRSIFGRRPAPRPAPPFEPVPIPGFVPHVSGPTDPMAMMAATLQNEVRASMGSGLLGLDDECWRLASGHAARMAVVGIVAHEGIGDGTFAQRVAASGLDVSRGCAENVSGHRSPQAVVDGWRTSAEHYINMTGPAYTRIGIAYAHSVNGDRFWCAVYA